MFRPVHVDNRGHVTAPSPETSSDAINGCSTQIIQKDFQRLESRLNELASAHHRLEVAHQKLERRNEMLENKVTALVEYKENWGKHITLQERDPSQPFGFSVVTPTRALTTSDRTNMEPNRRSSPAGIPRAESKKVYTVATLYHIRNTFVDGPVSKRTPLPNSHAIPKMSAEYKNIVAIPPLGMGREVVIENNPKSATPSGQRTKAKTSRAVTPTPAITTSASSRASTPTPLISPPESAELGRGGDEPVTEKVHGFLVTMPRGYISPKASTQPSSVTPTPPAAAEKTREPPKVPMWMMPQVTTEGPRYASMIASAPDQSESRSIWGNFDIGPPDIPASQLSDYGTSDKKEKEAVLAAMLAADSCDYSEKP